MSNSSTMLLIGIGGAGCRMARGISRAYGETLRLLLIDTDATSNPTDNGVPFALIGGDRLGGRGAGGDVVGARMAAEGSIGAIDEHLEGVRLAVIVAGLGGGTGTGATYETIRHLSERNIPSIVFATMPFAFEGEARQRAARGMIKMIESAANASFVIPLDKLVGDADSRMSDALSQGVDTLASAVTLFWRLVGKPGYIKLDAERIRRMISFAGRGRFATITTQGPNRAAEAVEALIHGRLLSDGSGPVKAVLCGILAGDDLRLSEVGTVANGLNTAFCSAAGSKFELATVNDEETFSGRLAVVAMMFESAEKSDAAASEDGTSQSIQAAQAVRRTSRRNSGKNPTSALSVGPRGRGRFNNAEPTIWHNEDLDVPTYIRKNLSLDF